MENLISSTMATTKANEVNKKLCKTLLCRIEEASEGGEYEIIVDEETAPKNKRRYLELLGFKTNKEYVNGFVRIKISW